MTESYVHRAVRQLERMFMRDPVVRREDIVNMLRLCVNCRPGGNHECTGKSIKITMVCDLPTHAKDRVEREEVPCQCYKCRVRAEPPV
jgi:hypothetical protein